MIFINAAPTASNSYGIYQSGTNANYFGGSLTVAGTLGVSGAVNLDSGTVAIAGGVVIGSPTGGNKGAGTINAANVYQNGVAVSTGGNVATSGSITTGYLAIWASSTTIKALNTIDAMAIGGTTPAAGSFTTLATTGNVGIGTSATSYCGLLVAPNISSSSNTEAIIVEATMAAAANSLVLISINAASSANSISTGGYTSVTYRGLSVGTPGTVTGTFSTSYQFYVAAAPAATTTYGIYQAGTDQNVLGGTLQAASLQNTPVGSTTASTGAFTTLSASSNVSITGVGSVGGPAASFVGWLVQNSLSGTSVGCDLNETHTATGNSQAFVNLQVASTFATATNTGLSTYGLRLLTPTLTGSGTITNAYQLYIAQAPNTGSGITVTNPYGIYQAGTDPNVLSGSLTLVNLSTAGIVTNQASGLLQSLSNASSVSATLMGFLGSNYGSTGGSASYLLSAAGTWVVPPGGLTGTGVANALAYWTSASNLSSTTAINGISIGAAYPSTGAFTSVVLSNQVSAGCLITNTSGTVVAGGLVFPESYGAYGDGTHDDTAALRAAAAACANGGILMLTKSYAIANSITLPPNTFSATGDVSGLGTSIVPYSGYSGTALIIAQGGDYKLGRINGDFSVAISITGGTASIRVNSINNAIVGVDFGNGAIDCDVQVMFMTNLTHCFRFIGGYTRQGNKMYCNFADTCKYGLSSDGSGPIDSNEVNFVSWDAVGTPNSSIFYVSGGYLANWSLSVSSWLGGLPSSTTGCIASGAFQWCRFYLSGILNNVPGQNWDAVCATGGGGNVYLTASQGGYASSFGATWQAAPNRRSYYSSTAPYFNQTLCTSTLGSTVGTNGTLITYVYSPYCAADTNSFCYRASPINNPGFILQSVTFGAYANEVVLTWRNVSGGSIDSGTTFSFQFVHGLP